MSATLLTVGLSMEIEGRRNQAAAAFKLRDSLNVSHQLSLVLHIDAALLPSQAITR